MRRALVTLACLAAIAHPAVAAELVPGLGVLGGWNSNVFASSTGQQPDFSGQFGPNLELRDPSGALRYDLHYRMQYQAYASIHELDALQHYFDGVGSWRFSPKTELSVSENFSLASTAVQLFNTSVPGTAGLVQAGPQVGLREVQLNSASATLVHSLSPAWRVETSYSDFRVTYPQTLGFPEFDSSSMGGSTQLLHTLSPRATMGAGASVTRQDFQTKNGTPGRGSTFYQTFGVLNYNVAPTVTLSASMGPALQASDNLRITNAVPAPVFPTIDGFPIAADTCPVKDGSFIFDRSKPGSCQAITAFGRLVSPVASFGFIGGNQNSNVQPTLTYYGSISLEKTWENLRASLEYNRSASTSSGFGTSTNLDVFRGTLVWTPTSTWTMTLNASLARQTSAAELQQFQLAVTPTARCAGGLCVAQTVGVTSKLVNNAIEILTYQAGLSVDRRISKRLTVFGRFDWWQQEQQAQQVSSHDYRFQLGFNWTFRAIPLWTEDL